MGSTRLFSGSSIPPEAGSELLAWLYSCDSSADPEENMISKRSDATSGIIDVAGSKSLVVSIIGGSSAFTWAAVPKLRGTNNPLLDTPTALNGIDLTGAAGVDGAFTAGPLDLNDEECVTVDCDMVPQFLFLTGGLPVGAAKIAVILIRCISK